MARDKGLSNIQLCIISNNHGPQRQTVSLLFISYMLHDMWHAIFTSFIGLEYDYIWAKTPCDSIIMVIVGSNNVLCLSTRYHYLNECLIIANGNLGNILRKNGSEFIFLQYNVFKKDLINITICLRISANDMSYNVYGDVLDGVLHYSNRTKNASTWYAGIVGTLK